MLNPYLLRTKLNIVAEKLAHRGFKLDVDKLRSLEKTRKALQVKTESLQAIRNSQSKLISQEKVSGKNTTMLYSGINQLDKELDKAKSDLKSIQSQIEYITSRIPNLPDDSVPIGNDKKCNIELKRWGHPRKFDFKIRDHVWLGKINNGLNFTDAVKLTGSRFVVMKGQIAHLHRALTQFMLDLHTEQHGYNEVYVPYLVNQDSLYGNGQLPKFSEDLFYIFFSEKKTNSNNYALIPTAEVPLINLVRNEILEEDNLPIKLTAHSPCFRSEAGSYGRDTRGLIRLHQFDKVEMVQIVRPEDSMHALESMTHHAEKVLELLELPYRRIILCTGDMGFVSCKTYDIEVWIPTKNMYLEVSSCSNVWDFQSRRMQARYRSKSNKKIRLVHTLNGSGLAVGRTLIAILENYQQIDGCIKIPKILCSYMKGQKYIGRCSFQNMEEHLSS